MHAHGTGLQAQAGLPYGPYVQLWLSPFGVPCEQSLLGTITSDCLMAFALPKP